jgi:hypothetical protein
MTAVPRPGHHPGQFLGEGCGILGDLLEGDHREFLGQDVDAQALGPVLEGHFLGAESSARYPHDVRHGPSIGRTLSHNTRTRAPTPWQSVTAIANPVLNRFS